MQINLLTEHHNIYLGNVNLNIFKNLFGMLY